MHNDCQGDQGQGSTKTSLCGRLVRGAGQDCRGNNCQTKSANSGFLGRVQGIKDEEFLAILRKGYSRLRKVRSSGARSSRVRQRKTASASSIMACSDGLCVVGQPFITSTNTTVSSANNLQAKNRNIWRATGPDHCNEVDRISVQIQQLACMLRLQGVTSDVSGNSDHMAACLLYTSDAADE